MRLRPIEHLGRDRVMAGVIARFGTIRLRPLLDPPFQSLVHAIIHQQLSGQSAAAILGRFLGLFPDVRFPAPETVVRTDILQLQSAGLSKAKAAYVKDLAQKSLDGYVPSLERCRQMSDDELIQLLTAIKGIGRWTVEMFLIFNLGRPDVLPVHDLGVRRGYQIAYKRPRLPEPGELQLEGAKWTPFRTKAALYLWRVSDCGAEDQPRPPKRQTLGRSA